MSFDPAERAPLNVHVRGSGPRAFVLLHGFTGSMETWPRVCIDGLAELGRVVTVDLPGHGGTRGTYDPAAFDMPVVVGRVICTLDSIGVARATWIGYSMGGRVALAAAVLHGRQVGGLVLESASPGLASEDARAERRAHDEALANRLEHEGLEAFVAAWMQLPLFASQQSLGADRLALERARRLRNDPAALAACLRGLGTGAQPSLWPRLPDVGAPVLVLTGSLDRKFSEIGRRMTRRIPDATHETVVDAGHAVHLERPADWLDAIRAFERRRRGEASGPAPAAHDDALRRAPG